MEIAGKQVGRWWNTIKSIFGEISSIAAHNNFKMLASFACKIVPVYE